MESRPSNPASTARHDGQGREPLGATGDAESGLHPVRYPVSTVGETKRGSQRVLARHVDPNDAGEVDLGRRRRHLFGQRAHVRDCTDRRHGCFSTRIVPTWHDSCYEPAGPATGGDPGAHPPGRPRSTRDRLAGHHLGSGCGRAGRCLAPYDLPVLSDQGRSLPVGQPHVRRSDHRSSRGAARRSGRRLRRVHPSAVVRLRSERPCGPGPAQQSGRARDPSDATRRIPDPDRPDGREVGSPSLARRALPTSSTSSSP